MISSITMNALPTSFSVGAASSVGVGVGVGAPTPFITSPSPYIPRITRDSNSVMIRL
jgi:hypothetical protein